MAPNLSYKTQLLGQIKFQKLHTLPVRFFPSIFKLLQSLQCVQKCKKAIDIIIIVFSIHAKSYKRISGFLIMYIKWKIQETTLKTEEEYIHPTRKRYHCRDG